MLKLSQPNATPIWIDIAGGARVQVKPVTVAAIIGKQLCSLGVVAKGLDRLSIGIGMIPRGEVGLIFANMGLTLTVAGEPVVTPAIFSAVIVMVMVTTVITPPALAWSFKRGARVAPFPTKASSGN